MFTPNSSLNKRLMIRKGRRDVKGLSATVTILETRQIQASSYGGFFKGLDLGLA